MLQCTAETLHGDHKSCKHHTQFLSRQAACQGLNPSARWHASITPVKCSLIGSKSALVIRSMIWQCTTSWAILALGSNSCCFRFNLATGKQSYKSPPAMKQTMPDKPITLQLVLVLHPPLIVSNSETRRIFLPSLSINTKYHTQIDVTCTVSWVA